MGGAADCVNNALPQGRGGTVARRLDEEKRLKILTAARRAFGEGGLQKTTIAHISRTADIAQGTVYTYFRNKEDLFLAVVEDIWREFMVGMERINLSDADLNRKFAEFVDFGFDLLTRIHPLLRGMFSEANRRELLAEKLDQIVELVDRFFVEGEGAEGILPGVSTDPEVRKFNIDLMVSGILFRTSLVAPAELQDEIQRLKDGLMAGLTYRLGMLIGTPR